MMKRLVYFPWNILANLLWVYLCYGIFRIAFLLENWSSLQQDLSLSALLRIWHGGLLFDTSAICYTNILYVVLAILPLVYLHTRFFTELAKWVYVAVNAVVIVINLMDTTYFSFTQKRVMANVFSEFEDEGSNLFVILGAELLHHWYFVLLTTVMIYLLIHLYRKEIPSASLTKKRIALRIVAMAVMLFLMLCGMRGCKITTASRPLSVNDAMQYTNKPLQTNIVLNTGFSLIRTANNKPIKIPAYFKTQAQMGNIYTPLHQPADSMTPNKKNVVILIVESFAQEFIGILNQDLDNGTYTGYTPFTDSLLQHSLTFEDTFCNTWTSIDAMPAVFASIPRMSRPFVLTPYSLNNLTSIPGELGKWGYETAFFHGAENNSMGFHAFANSVGFQHYYGRTEYENDKQWGGKDDFDGTWGIWDEPFLQFFCHKMTEMKEPFMTAVFTLSSHHPFVIPEKYQEVFKDEGIHKLHKCIRYTDYALRRFFETASRQAWYKHTIFILTADHASSKTTHAEYKTELGHFRVPILIFDPSGELPRGKMRGIAQQIDLMPTLFGILGYDKPFISFGKDLLHTPEQETWAFNWNTIPQLIMGDYLIQFDCQDITAIYNYKQDPLLQHNIQGQVRKEQQMLYMIQAILQSYSERMDKNEMTIK